MSLKRFAQATYYRIDHLHRGRVAAASIGLRGVLWRLRCILPGDDSKDRGPETIQNPRPNHRPARAKTTATEDSERGRWSGENVHVEKQPFQLVGRQATTRSKALCLGKVYSEVE